VAVEAGHLLLPQGQEVLAVAVMAETIARRLKLAPQILAEVEAAVQTLVPLEAPAL
jgi:hypothetical protein